MAWMSENVTNKKQKELMCGVASPEFRRDWRWSWCNPRHPAWKPVSVRGSRESTGSTWETRSVFQVEMRWSSLESNRTRRKVGSCSTHQMLSTHGKNIKNICATYSWLCYDGIKWKTGRLTRWKIEWMNGRINEWKSWINGGLNAVDKE